MANYGCLVLAIVQRRAFMILVLHIPKICYSTELYRLDLYALWSLNNFLKLAISNINTLIYIICYFYLDYCILSNSTPLSVVKKINEKFNDFSNSYQKIVLIPISFHRCCL